jgi:hypothetical protein
MAMKKSEDSDYANVRPALQDAAGRPAPAEITIRIGKIGKGPTSAWIARARMSEDAEVSACNVFTQRDTMIIRHFLGGAVPTIPHLEAAVRCGRLS